MDTQKNKMRQFSKQDLQALSKEALIERILILEGWLYHFADDQNWNYGYEFIGEYPEEAATYFHEGCRKKELLERELEGNLRLFAAYIKDGGRGKLILNEINRIHAQLAEMGE